MEGVIFDELDLSPLQHGGSSVNHVVGIENGQGQYLVGSKAVDLEQLRRNEAGKPSSNDDVCAVCGEKANGVHFGSKSCAACSAFLRTNIPRLPRFI
jgi:hypothetical protein